MKRIYTVIISLAVCLSLPAQTNFWVHKSDGTSVQYAIAEVDSISFLPFGGGGNQNPDPDPDPDPTPCTPVNVANGRNNYCFTTSNANNGNEGFCYIGAGFNAINMCNENFANGNNLLGTTATTAEVAVMVDLGDTYSVSSVRLYQGSTNANYPASYCRSYAVWYSTQDVNATNQGNITWQQAATYNQGAIFNAGSIVAGNAAYTTTTGDIVNFDAVNARSIKIVFDKNACNGTGNPAGTVSVVSLQVYGCNAEVGGDPNQGGGEQGGGEQGGGQQGGGQQGGDTRFPTEGQDPGETPYSYADPTGQIDILFIGNSLTYYNTLAGVVQGIARLKGHNVNCTAATNGGKNLIYQASNDATNVDTAIKQGGYEIVVLQDIVGNFNANNLNTGATACINKIRQYNPNAKILFYAPWPTSGNLTGANSTLPYVTTSYANTARANSARLAPAGEAFFDLFYFYGYNWYDDDRHPVPLGTFVSASTIYYTLFNSEPFVSFTADQQSQLDTIIKSNIAYSGQGHLSTYPVETLNLILGKGFYYAHAVAPSVADLSGNTTYTSIANVTVQEGQELLARFASNANLAHGSTATASSGNGSLAVDSQNGTRWESTHGVDPQWIAIDLGSARTFSKVAVMWENAYASAYQIQTSNDGTNWTTKLECTASSAQTVEKYIGETTARYVRIYGTARGTGYGYSIYELGVW